MINIANDIHPLTEFKRDTNRFLEDLKRTKRPAILTVNGKASLVVMDATTFQEIQETLEMKDSVARIATSLKDFEAENSKPAKEVFAGLKKSLKPKK